MPGLWLYLPLMYYVIMQLWIYQAELYLAVRSIYDSLILSEKLGGGILDSRNKLLQDRILTVCLPGIKQTKSPFV